jgi:RecA-family ATPase
MVELTSPGEPGATHKQNFDRCALGLPEVPVERDQHGITNVWKNLGEFLATDFPPVEEVMRHVEKGTLTQFCAATNVGKTTLLLNASIALAGGQPFPPLILEVGRPRRVLYVDFETGCSKMKDALLKMLSRHPYTQPEVRSRVLDNLALMVDTEIGEYPLMLSEREHLNLVLKRALEFEAEAVIIDNVSAGFEIESDNANSEVASKIMLPLKGFAKKTGAAVVFVHHTGKPSEGTRSAAGAFMGRGASNFANLSRSIYGMVPSETMGERYIVLQTEKNKNGLKREQSTLKLDLETLSYSLVGSVEKQELTAESIRDYVRSCGKARDHEIVKHFTDLGFTKATVDDRIKRAKKAKMICKDNKRAPYRVVNETQLSDVVAAA